MDGQDKIEYEILEDGRIKFTTDPISAPNHANAEAFLALVSKMLGGETTRVRRSDQVHSHKHSHGTKIHQH